MNKWTTQIKPQSKWYEIDFKAIWNYRDLLVLFVKRDFISVYKQTILGPLWFFLQPIFQTITFTIIFGNFAQIPTDGVPPLIFYLSGITFWNYFSSCLISTSNTFVQNAGVFGKVYFPRLITPISIIISNLIKFGIQLMMFFCFYIYFLIKGQIFPNITILLFPIYMIMMAGLGLGFGILISSLTTKYRDLSFLVGFGVQLLMYASPIIYPFSMLKPSTQFLLNVMNPMSSIIEALKYGLLGKGIFSIPNLIMSFVYMLLILAIGLIAFNKVEKKFMDTV